jgi:citrate synthase
MDKLKLIFQEKATALGKEIKDLIKHNGDKVVDQSTIRQLYGGMRGLKSMTFETSALDPIEGIRFRGFSIPELREKLPTAEDGNEPLPEGLFWLLLTGEMPENEDVKWVTKQWQERANLPQYTKDSLDALPKDTHPMTMFSMGILSLGNNSIFRDRYAEGMTKFEYWDPTYEDSMNLIATLPHLAAYIYNIKYNDGKQIEPDNNLDWSANFAHMLGNDSKGFKELMRIYMTIHSDHEGGNASAHTTHLVNSTLSDVFNSLSAGINALAGPLHGLANQEVIKWVFEMIDELGTDTPSDDEIKKFIEKTLNSGRVIPGYGHAVLRRPDPRFVAQKRFAERNIKDSKLVNIIWQLYEHVPPILQSLGKVKNPWPNVDAHSGALLVHYGFEEYEFYTVLFGVSRALGVLAASTWSRALGLALERPKSVTTEWVKEFVKFH